jgi:hypothetical protein
MNIQVEEPCIITKFDEGTNSNDLLKLPRVYDKNQKPLASFLPAPDRSKSIEQSIITKDARQSQRNSQIEEPKIIKNSISQESVMNYMTEMPDLKP